jgi:cytidine deaminase
MNPIQQDQLVHLAVEACDMAYAPYSNFQVGAALLTRQGKIYQGVNVENRSFGLTICAERTAAATAISEGHKDFTAISIASRGGVTPCGACRQFLAEFCDDLTILLVDVETGNRVRETTLNKLLPDRFTELG